MKYIKSINEFKSKHTSKELAMKVIDELGYEYIKTLGAGLYGDAFLIKFPGEDDEKVLKITKDVKEAETANTLRKKPVTKHLINYYDVREIESESEIPVKNFQYSIIMDKVDKIEHPLYKILSIIIGYNNYLRSRKTFDSGLISEFKKILLHDLLYHDMDKDVAIKLIDDTMNQLIEMNKESNKYLNSSIIHLDFHMGNLGLKDGNIVFFDLRSFKHSKIDLKTIKI